MSASTFLVGALLLVGCTASPSGGVPGGEPVSPGVEPASPQVEETPSEAPSGPSDGDGQPDSVESESPDSPGAAATVTSVTDGDTVDVAFRGRVLDIRLIGIDTPETVDPSESVGCYGPEASRFTESRLAGEKVSLEFDVERIDRYGRTLAYVWFDRRLFNEVLVRRGFAQVTTYPPNVKYVDRFLAAQRVAREGGKGLWGSCEGSGALQEATEVGGRCDPSYPGVCIEPYPPDLDCAEVPDRRFQVQGADPHGFDGDHDGVGCET